MIFYFSGTGNSLYAATTIAKQQSDKVISIADEMKKDPKEMIYSPADNEMIGFVYPIYAWGPPEIVIDFIRSMKINDGKRYIFSVNTCGSEEGHATKVLQNELLKKNLILSSAFSISMPSNYVIGEDVENEKVQREKLSKAAQRLSEINAVLKNREVGVFQLLEGSNPGLKTKIVSPLFNKFARSTKKFYATDACIHCGLCEKICPTNTIVLKEKPVWGNKCTQCLGCINRCPVKAIQYGEKTEARGRYTFNNILEG